MGIDQRMAQPVMCPVCGTHNFFSISSGESIHPSVAGQVKTGVNFFIFSCENAHVFLTLEESADQTQAIADGHLYERHRRN